MTSFKMSPFKMHDIIDAMARDDLDKLVAAETRRNRQFPKLVRAAERRQRFGFGLAKKREQLGISQRAMALQMKTSTTVVARIEQGGDVQLTTLERYLSVLGLALKLGTERASATARA